MTTTNDELPENISLGDRMKRYESIYDKAIPADNYLVIRLDGHGFSKFTKNLQKPFDFNFSKAMVMSASDAVSEFTARSAYTQSDEITLIFDVPDLSKRQTYIFGGRTQKLLSLIPSFVTARFNYHLQKLVAEDTDTYKKHILDKINKSLAYFDARILTFELNRRDEVLNHLIWRSVKDCHRNCIQLYGHHLFGPKKNFNLNGKQIIELLKTDKNLNWETDVPLWQKYGVFIKKELIFVTTDNGSAYRNKMKAISFKLQFSENILKFFLEKYFKSELLEEIVFEPYEIPSMQ